VWLAEAQARAGDADARARLAAFADARELPVALKAALALGDVSPPGDATAIARLTALAKREGEIRDPSLTALILAKLGRLRVEDARKLLLSGLESNDEQARLACAEGLARLGDDSGKKILLDILADPASPNRLIAASVLVALGDDSGYPLFLDKIADPDPGARRLAARGLGLVGERDGAIKLADAMQDKEAAVRIASAAAIVAIVAVDPKLLAQASVDWTRSALAAEDWATRESAAALVGVVPEREAIPLLAQALADPQPEVRRAAVKSARRLKGRAAAHALAAAAPHEADAGVKEEMARSLGGPRGVEARVALGELAKEQGAVGAAAAAALFGAGDAGAKARVEAALADSRPEVRRAALEAAAAAPSAAFVPLLETALADKTFELRLLAAETLSRLAAKSPATTTVLKSALAEKDAGVRARAAGALLRLAESLDGLGAPTPRELLADADPATRRAALAIIAAMPAGDALPLLRRALLDADVDTRKAALDALLAFSAADPDGVARLHRLALRDTDPAVRAQAQGQLAGLLQPAPPEPEAATDLAALAAAGDELIAAAKDALEFKGRAEKCAADVTAAAAAAARDDAAIKAMEGLVHVCVEVAEQAQVARGRVDATMARAEIAAGDKPTPEAVKLVDAARAGATDARAVLDAAGGRAEEAARRGRSWIQNETGDATTFIAAAEAALAAGNLGEARRALDRADKLLRAARKDTAPVKYGYGQLYDKLAGREKQPAARVTLLKKAKAYYDEFAAHGSGPRVTAAKERAQELADEIKELAP
jgi:HEAT repeat protein